MIKRAIVTASFFLFTFTGISHAAMPLRIDGCTNNGSPVGTVTFHWSGSKRVLSYATFSGNKYPISTLWPSQESGMIELVLLNGPYTQQGIYLTCPKAPFQ